ncbi:hypothetical protein CVM73_31960 [Bradyrhizobium forestalis]|uniref:DUF1476 domain-containing protein n=2 Tax=Bradyrhizobium forestalis TaxID=1419263 RepID=A0A2M8R091_9BRAD|nr:hypothetical protein CVM73_31960 [Bradyrhizobium forestalis]
MSSFDERENAFETEFAHREESKVRVRERAVASLAQWAARRLGRSAAAAKVLTQEVLEADVASPTVEPTIDRIVADLAPVGIPKQEVWQAMHRFLAEAEVAERSGRPWRELVRGKFTLPELENGLEALQNGALVQIDRADYERLFGLNDVALGRLRNFARSHQCIVSFADTIVLFRKHIAPVEEGLDPQQ